MTEETKTNVFAEPTPNTNPDTSNQEGILAQLVGEGKKFKTVEDLAKGKLESDVYVESLKTQLAASEAKNAQAVNADEKFAKILQQIEQSKQTPTQGNPQAPVLGTDEIATLVRNQMTRVEQERTAQQNIDQTNSKLNELYGDKAIEVVTARAKALGVSMADLKQISSKSPNAFLTMIGATETKPNKEPNSNPNGSVNTESNFNKDFKAGTKEYYNNLRRENPKLYYSKTIHEVMDKVKKGELVL